MTAHDLSTQRLALDVQSVQDLRAQAKRDPQGALKEAARQFEAVFLGMMLKSMRDAVPQDGLTNSDSTRFYTSLLDQQLAQNLSGQSGSNGLAQLLERQLGRALVPAAENEALLLRNVGPGQALPLAVQGASRLRTTPAEMAATPAIPAAGAAANVLAAGSEAPVSGDTPRDFVNRVWPHALEASQNTGIPAHFLVAHAALESGWGRHEIIARDGSTTHNLFGIKAGRNWNGASVEAATTEYVDGVAQPRTERFRAYASYGEAFADYAALLKNNSRFSGVLGQQDGTTFARSLQQAGYATDPMYAEKLSRIINGNTLRQALAG